MNKIVKMTICCLAALSAADTKAQVNAADSVMQHVRGNKLSVGGYGEVAYSRNFYSDNVYRYSKASQYKDDPSHGRFDVPHAVVYLSYDFGKGWTMSSEIEFEHTGTGSAVEQEFEEAGEWEQEVEKGGEVALEQFWIQKSFSRAANLRLGHLVLPVGLNNAYHEPLNYFTVYRPEGENTILPSAWHDTGVSFWGRKGAFKYNVMMVAGLDAFKFTRDGWIHGGAGSSFEYKVANKYGFAARLDNYSVPGLRIGISGYYGQSMHNTQPHDMENDGNANKSLKGTVAIGSVDFTLNRWNWIVRGQADYGYVSDAAAINSIKRTRARISNSPYSSMPFGKNAMAVGIEAGYDVLALTSHHSVLPSHPSSLTSHLYIFGRFEKYNSYIPSNEQQKYEFTDRTRFVGGINYYPVPQIVLKAEYSYRNLKSQYNDEPSINIGVAYQGFFM